MQEPSYQGKSPLVSTRFWMALIQVITRVYKESLTLRYPPNINIWLVLQIWYPRVGSLILLWMLIVDTMHSTYILFQLWYKPVLVWYHFLKYHSSIYNEDFTFFWCTVAMGIWQYSFSMPFRFTYHARIFMPWQTHPSINMIQNNIDSNNNSGMQRFSHLDIPTKYQ